MRRTLAALLLAAGFVLPAVPALAHAHLVKASPADGAVLTASPSDLRLTFSESVEARFSGVDITGADGRKIATGRPGGQGAEMVVPLANPLPPGTYKVNWHVVSVDGHKTAGSFTFEVKP